MTDLSMTQEKRADDFTRREFLKCIGVSVAAGAAADSPLSATNGQRAALVQSSSLAAHFSKDWKLIGLENRMTGERLRLDDAEQFLLETDNEKISGRNSQLVSARATPTGAVILYRHHPFEIGIVYELKAGDHFMEKRVWLRHRGGRPFAIRRFSLHQWKFSANSGQLVPFQHGQCVTYFLRKDTGGFFFGLRTPFEEVLPSTSTYMDLAYPVNIIFPPGSRYEAEVAYWGAYRLTGRQAPKAPPKIKESILSPNPPDAGESEAMLRMVEKLAPPRRSLTVVYSGYQGGLSFGDYGGPDGVQQAERDKEVLDVVKEMLGPSFVCSASPWFGAFQEAVQLKPADQRINAPKPRQELLDWINANGMKPLSWASLRAVDGWRRPRLGPYCQGYAAWQANPFSNCVANPQFVDWFTRIAINDFKTGFGGFASDEPPPGLRYAFRCEKANHGHLPGDVSYAYFYRRRRMFEHFRQALGPDFELQGQRPHMDAGIWDAIYLNSLFTFLEDPGWKADTIRKWSRLRRAYSFVPSYMDQVPCQPGLEQVDYLMLSLLAVSSNYLFCAPTTKAALPAHARAVADRDSRVMAEGLKSFPAEDKRRVRFWLDWARASSKYMDHVIDLPDWPGSGRPDGYLRLKDRRGFAFLFNPGPSPAAIEVPLDDRVGLEGERSHTLTQIHPPTAAPPLALARTARVSLQSQSAYLIQIEPSGA